MGYCEDCRYAEWEEVDTDRGSFWSMCECNAEDAPDDPEYGACKDCPAWEKQYDESMWED